MVDELQTVYSHICGQFCLMKFQGIAVRKHSYERSLERFYDLMKSRVLSRETRDNIVPFQIECMDSFDLYRKKFEFRIYMNKTDYYKKSYKLTELMA